ncbi:MAG: hypothetical protein KU38_09025 [Sulfurovum sp. FS08-3]|nr:MAG: hypothetical protein KU38_09025 [Sulfurovum sp. FS08-3]
MLPKKAITLLFCQSDKPPHNSSFPKRFSHARKYHTTQERCQSVTDVTHFAYQIIFELVIVRHEAIYFK